MSENDPWKRLVALVAHLTPNTEDGARRSMAVLDAMEAQFAARAAEATQHQQEIESLHRRHADELAAVRSSQQLIDQIATLRAERDRLKAALSTAAFALDLAGFRRDRDAAYAALTPQGQSTDGETR